jgi:membrane-bound lytic murein transglycosylase A
MPARICSALLFILSTLGISGAVTSAAARDPAMVKFPNSQYEPVAWSDLDGWASDDHVAGLQTFLTSCKAILPPRAAAREKRPIFAALKEICRSAAAAGALDEEKARAFFEKNFRPLRIATLGESNGFLTGYYEPIVEGSRFHTEEYTVPLYRRPSNLAVAGQRKASENFPSKGAQVGRKVGRRKIEPYYDRAQIEGGALEGRGLEICWLKDPVDLFFVQIQGSARVQLEDGTLLRVNYDAHNGYSYTAVGKFLIDRGLVPREEMSLDRIRHWMAENPAEGKEVRQKNRSYVFFRDTGLSEKDEPIGAQGIPVTSGRSIAVDKAIHVYGTPFFIEADLPIDNMQPTTKFRRLMVAQDTGSAIVGPARADIYFGAGPELGSIAGRIRHPGRFSMLIPRSLDPVEAGKDTPLPRAKPVLLAQDKDTKKSGAVPLPKPKPVAARGRKP